MSIKRKLGIVNAPEASWGTHFCNFYFDKGDFINVLVPYFAAGLENNELCVWITSGAFNAEEAKAAMSRHMPDFKRYLDKGQIEIISYDQWYLMDGVFDSERVLDAWLDKLNRALEAGYDGLRASGSTDWVQEKQWEQFMDYEKKVNAIIEKYKMLAICNYSLINCPAPEIADAAFNHQFCIISKEGRQRVIADGNNGSIVRNLRDKIRNLEKYNKIFLDREMRIIELKREIQFLKKRLEDKYK